MKSVVGSAFNDTLVGNNGKNWLTGGAGNDTIAGLDGNDFLYGAARQGHAVRRRERRLSSTAALDADKLDGGNGNDNVDYTWATGKVTINLANLALNTGDAKGDTYFSIEEFYGSSFGDTFIGNTAADRFGSDGNDWLMAARTTTCSTAKTRTTRSTVAPARTRSMAPTTRTAVRRRRQ